MACSMFITAQDSTLTQSVASRPYGSGWPQVYFTVLVPGLQLLPCVGLSAHQHQSMSSAVSHAWMLAHQLTLPEDASELTVLPNSPIQSGAMFWVRMYPPAWFIAWA